MAQNKWDQAAYSATGVYIFLPTSTAVTASPDRFMPFLSCLNATGAMVLGRVSTATIAGGIADINAFRYDPEVSTP